MKFIIAAFAALAMASGMANADHHKTKTVCHTKTVVVHHHAHHWHHHHKHCVSHCAKHHHHHRHHHVFGHWFHR